MEETNYIKNIIKQIPELPGIYKMLDAGNNIIYIGKSKCLKKRVASYFTNSNKWEKVARMVPMIKDIEYIITDTHLDARLLECKLIKDYQPRFNAQMKNDQRYIFIKVEGYNQHRSICVVNEREADCFGPFRRSKYSMNEFLDRLKSFYPITRMDDCYKFDFHLFPVTMDKESFESNRTVLLELFSSSSNIQLLADAFQDKLEEAVSDYRYEMASIYRDMISGLAIIKHALERYHSLASRNFLLKLPIQDGYKLFYFTSGQIINSIIAPKLTTKIIRAFVKDTKIILRSHSILPDNEKAQLDYQDIIYSEISELQEEMVELL